jgi:hypothetical protein
MTEKDIKKFCKAIKKASGSDFYSLNEAIEVLKEEFSNYVWRLNPSTSEVDFMRKRKEEEYDADNLVHTEQKIG